LEVKLVEVGRHAAAAAVAKLDGWDVNVGDAARLVGKKVNVRVARVLDGTAYATLTDDLPEVPPTPITAEAQAEKPTRASRAKKADEPAPEATTEGAVTATEEVVDEEAETAVDAAGEQAPPKKKTRRGSRGGRGRKKPASVGVAAETNGAGEPEAVEPRRPTIHVPEAETAVQNGDETTEAPPRKKTRRGSRGGRRRRKPAAAAAAEQASDES